MISIERIKTVIADQQQQLRELREKSKLIERDLSTQQVVKIFRKGPGLVVIQGVRRCGKSTFALSCFQQPSVYINFDDERFFELKAEDLDNLLGASYELYGTEIECFVFDEIQNIRGWELFISRIQRSKKVIITGSNSNLLSKELATHLTGRYHLITLYPFSFREFLKLLEEDFPTNLDTLSTKRISQIKTLLSRYVLEGGFPDVQQYGRGFAQNVYSDIISKDIFQRYRLKAPETFRKLALFVISNFGQEINVNKIAKHIGIKDPHTAARYISYLEETYLAFSLTRYFHRLKAQLVTNKKFYSIDSGLISSTAFNPTSSRGALIENIVFLELLRRRDYTKAFEELFFWHGSKYEVDFLIRDSKNFSAALQVSTDLSEESTFEREVDALTAVKDELNPRKLLLINDSLDKKLSLKGLEIQAIPLWKWLLNTHDI